MNDYDDPALIDNCRCIFEQQRQQLFRRTDRMFAVLMALQWVGGIVAACILTPKTWSGSYSETHPHVWLAVVFGGTIASLPIFLAWRFPGRALTRQVIAVAQMMFSSLFIHISGGRIETHFHVFGSLAFLAFYRDWRVLIPPTVVVALDHYIRGVYWPETVFGVSAASPWRWLEHSAWVAFEDIFLIIACHYGVKEMWNNGMRTAELERMNDESAVRAAELEQAYQTKTAVVETALDAVVGMDIEGRITGWNSQAEQTFGWTIEEALGRNLSETIIPPSHREAHRMGLVRYRESGAASALNRRIEVTALHRNGHEFPVELAIAPIHTGANVSFCAFVRDITERQQAAEALLRAKDAAEAANSAKSAFLAHMSHEIRTPLNGILGFADVLLKMGPEAGDTERREYLETINHSGRHLLELINDVLDLSKVESGQMDVTNERCAPHEIIADAISILRVRAHEKGINLESTWQGKVPETIVTDPSRFRQLLMNLIGNAIKFTEQGNVDVVARLSGAIERPQLAVDVIDTGIGIAPAQLESIFEPFTQADQSITRRFGGTGLGLTISRQIAALLGGQLTVRSELGRGSTFTATIEIGALAGVRLMDAPQADLIPRRKSAQEAVQVVLPPSSILLVEDGVANRKLISLMLRRAGANVVTAENGQVALDLTEKHGFDLILMDMQMPVLDGYSAATALRRRGLKTPIIALTAHSMKGDEDRCRAAGCSGYLTKPIEVDRLLRVVLEVLGGKDASPRASAPIVVCGDRLRSSLPMDDPEFREIVVEFVGRLREVRGQMEAAVRNKDFNELARCAHWLKGAGGTSGFHAFTAPAAALEQLAKSKETKPLRAALDDLTRLCERIELPVSASVDATSA